jgi:pilus assembly protein Flp/PilA
VAFSFRKLWCGESGQDLVEYALLAALIAVASVAALSTLGPAVSNFYSKVQEAFAGSA